MQSVAKWVGKGLGAASTISAGLDFIENPSVGNAVKLGVNGVLLFAKVNPAVSIGVAILDASGVSDKIYSGIDSGVDYIRAKL